MKFKYDWSSDLRVYNSLIRIYNGSLEKLSIDNYILEYAAGFIEDTEEFLYGMKQLFPNYFDNVLDALEKLKGISFVSMKEEIETFVQKRDGYVLIDPITVVDYLLYVNPSNRKKISVFQGLASVVFEFMNDNTLEFTEKYNWFIKHRQVAFGDIKKDKDYINYGWQLLEDAFSQVLAQKVYRFIAADENAKIQSDSSFEKRAIVIDTAYWDFTNDVTRFNDLMIRFGITIKGISIADECSSEVIICRLLKKALQGNFAETAIGDYQRRGQEVELYHILYNMGKLYKNRMSGHQIRLVNDDYTKKIYDNLLLMMSKLVVFDEHEEDFKQIDTENSQKVEECKVKALVNISDRPTLYDIIK